MDNADTNYYNKIVDRYLELVAEMHVDVPDRMTVMLTLLDVDDYIPLRIPDLANAQPYDLVHDMGGMLAHWNHRTSKMEDCFLPRYAK